MNNGHVSKTATGLIMAMRLTLSEMITQIDMTLRHGETATVNVTVRALRRSLDLVVVEDFSRSFQNDIDTLANLFITPEGGELTSARF